MTREHKHEDLVRKLVHAWHHCEPLIDNNGVRYDRDDTRKWVASFGLNPAQITSVIDEARCRHHRPRIQVPILLPIEFDELFFDQPPRIMHVFAQLYHHRKAILDWRELPDHLEMSLVMDDFNELIVVTRYNRHTVKYCPIDEFITQRQRSNTLLNVTKSLQEVADIYDVWHQHFDEWQLDPKEMNDVSQMVQRLSLNQSNMSAIAHQCYHDLRRSSGRGITYQLVRMPLNEYIICM